MPNLFLINTIRFTCGDKKISSNIKKSENIMSRIVATLKFRLRSFKFTRISEIKFCMAVA